MIQLGFNFLAKSVNEMFDESYVLHRPSKGLFRVAERDEGFWCPKKVMMLVNQIKWDFEKFSEISISEKSDFFPLHQRKPWHWTIADQVLWKVNGGKPTSVGNSTKKSVPTQGVQTAGLRIDEVPNVTSLNRLMTPPCFHSHRIHVAYAYIIYMGIPETGKLTVSQPESFMVKFGDFVLCGEDGL